MPAITVPASQRQSIQIPTQNKQWKPKHPIERISVSVEEAAVMLSLCVRSVLVLVKEGKIKHVKFGTRCIVSVQSIRDFVDGKMEPEIQLNHSDKPRGEKTSQ